MILSTLGGLFLVVAGLELAMLDEGAGIHVLICTPAIKLMLICGLGAALLSAPGVRALTLPLTLLKLLLPSRYRPAKTATLVESCLALAEQVQASGPAALATFPPPADPFLRRGIALLGAGTDGKTVAEVLHAEIAAMVRRHAETYGLVARLGQVAAGTGTVGSLIGIIVTLSHLEDTSRLGPAIAVSLLSSLYGAILSAMILTPLGAKLQQRSEQEAAMKRLLVDGLLALQRGEAPSLVRERLMAELSERQRARLQRRLASRLAS